MEAAAAGSQHSVESLLLPEPQPPHLVSMGRVAVAPGALPTHVPALRPTPTGSSLLLSIHPRNWGKSLHCYCNCL